MFVPMDRFVGTTEECFFDFIGKYPQPAMVLYIGKFCKVSREIVQHWQYGDYFPGGLAVMRLRSLLYLADYDVVEFRRCTGIIQSLALLFSVDILDLDSVNTYLGYKSVEIKKNPRLIRLVVFGDQYPEDIGRKIDIKVKRHRKTLETKLVTEREKLQAVIAAITPRVATPQIQASTTVDPAFAHAVARSIGSTAALCHMAKRIGAGQGVFDATRNGQDIVELIEVLQTLAARPSHDVPNGMS